MHALFVIMLFRWKHTIHVNTWKSCASVAYTEKFACDRCWSICVLNKFAVFRSNELVYVRPAIYEAFTTKHNDFLLPPCYLTISAWEIWHFGVRNQLCTFHFAQKETTITNHIVSGVLSLKGQCFFSLGIDRVVARAQSLKNPTACMWSSIPRTAATMIIKVLKTKH